MPGLSRVCSLLGHEERVWCVAWRPRAEPLQLASCSADRTIRIWGLKSDASVDSQDGWALLCEIDASDQHSRTLRSVTWSPDGKIAAVASFDATVSLWMEARSDDASSLQFECVGIVKGHENEVKCAAFSPTGEYFATCSRDKSVWIYETEDANFEYECAALLQSHTQDIKCVRWHPSQDILFSCSYDDTIKIWGPDGDDWSCKETLQGHDSTVWCLSFDAAGARFATCGDDRNVKIWAPSDQVPKKQEAPAPNFFRVATAPFVAPLFRAASGLTKSGSSTAASDMAPPEVPADASCPWECIATLQGQHPRPVYACDWLRLDTTSGRTALATACGDNHVRIFVPEDESSPNAWHCAADVTAHDGDANTLAWCPRQPSMGVGLLATGGDDCEVVLWRFED